MIPFAQTVPPPNFWAEPPGSSALYIKLLIGLIVGLLGLFALMRTPPQMRRHVVAFFVFLSGLFYVLFYLWPKPVDLQPDELPQGFVETVGATLQSGFSVVVPFTNIIAGFLVGLGVYSLLRIHGVKLVRRQRDWPFSAVLLGSLVFIFVVGILDWKVRQGPNAERFDLFQNRTFVNHARDLLFDGLLQQMDAAMFSLIAFYILSAAYRAFRIRSIEATILLATALLVVVSLMGLVQNGFDNLLPKEGLLANFRLLTIRQFVQDTFQTPALRGISFGIGIGALAMGLRIWLSLERAGSA